MRDIEVRLLRMAERLFTVVIVSTLARLAWGGEFGFGTWIALGIATVFVTGLISVAIRLRK